jgi:hypothetical protein
MKESQTPGAPWAFALDGIDSSTGKPLIVAGNTEAIHGRLPGASDPQIAELILVAFLLRRQEQERALAIHNDPRLPRMRGDVPVFSPTVALPLTLIGPLPVAMACPSGAAGFFTISSLTMTADCASRRKPAKVRIAIIPIARRMAQSTGASDRGTTGFNFHPA